MRARHQAFLSELGYDTFIVAALRTEGGCCDNSKCYYCLKERSEESEQHRVLNSQPFKQDGARAEDECFAVEWERVVGVNEEIIAKSGPIVETILSTHENVLKTSIQSDSDIIKACIQGDQQSTAKSIKQKIIRLQR